MKKLFTKLLMPILVITLFSSVQTTFAQNQAVEEITEGKEYWLGLPLCGREEKEAIRGDYPVAFWISSKVDTRATISDQETGTITNVVIRKNQITQVPYGDHVMNKVSEVPKNYGIHVTADDPISVAVYMSYKWTGEAFRVMPVEWLGREYVTMNMYQDQLSQSDNIRPPQILITATEDDTKVTYRPTTETMKGIKAGELGSTTLMKGQTFLILGSLKENLSQDISTDLSGTYITANKPISVISGHTKAAFPRYQFTFLGRDGGFMRNVMIDVVWPIELLGKEYISAPIKYADRRRDRIQDDRGDLIRFVASEDGTIISQMKKDGTGLMPISPTLKRGQFFDIVNQEAAAFYSANKKVLVAQYGKTWWIHAVHPEAPPKDSEDETLNPSRNGQGMLITLTPLDHWTSYATWRSPGSIDNFIYVTFKTEHLDYLYFDGIKLSDRFGNAVKYIDGTDYSYLAESISAGDHYMYGDTIPGTDGKEKGVFSTYAYGNWDRSKDGFAYGYPVGIRYNSPCDDSLLVSDTIIYGVVTGDAQVMPEESDCAWLYNILPSDLINYEFTINSNPEFIPGHSKTAGFTLTPINPKRHARGTVRIITKSGKTQTIIYEYWPEEIAFDPEIVDFGLLQEGDEICGKTFDIVNISKKVPVTINNLYLENGKPEFKINVNSKDYPITYPFTLQPGERKTVEICANAPVYAIEKVKDNIIAELTNYEWDKVELIYKMGDPVVWIDDAVWENVYIGVLVSKEVQIINRSGQKVILTKITWPEEDKNIFSKVEGLPCAPQGGDFTTPLILGPYADTSFTTYFHPDAVGTHKTEALFEGNTTRDKLNSIWEGYSYTGVEKLNSNNNRIQVRNGKIIINKLPGRKYSLNIYDILGKPVLYEKTSSSDMITINTENIPSGAYIVSFIQGKEVLIKIIIK